MKRTLHILKENTAQESVKKKAVEDKNKPILQLHFLQLTKEIKGHTHNFVKIELNYSCSLVKNDYIVF